MTEKPHVVIIAPGDEEFKQKVDSIVSSSTVMHMRDYDTLQSRESILDIVRHCREQYLVFHNVDILMTMNRLANQALVHCVRSCQTPIILFTCRSGEERKVSELKKYCSMSKEVNTHDEYHGKNIYDVARTILSNYDRSLDDMDLALTGDSVVLCYMLYDVFPVAYSTMYSLNSLNSIHRRMLDDVYIPMLRWTVLEDMAFANNQQDWITKICVCKCHYIRTFQSKEAEHFKGTSMITSDIPYPQTMARAVQCIIKGREIPIDESFDEYFIRLSGKLGSGRRSSRSRKA